MVIHYHLRPGGVRRVIERSLPLLVNKGPKGFSSVTLAVGERAGREWEAALGRSLPPDGLRILYEPAFGYFSESRVDPATLRRRIRAALEKALPADTAKETLLWTHNMGLGRNGILSEEISRLTAARGVARLTQHHDFWFENRWARWPELQQCGYRTLSSVARAFFGGPGGVLTVNRADKEVFERHLPGQAAWLPNPVSLSRPLAKTKILALRRTLAGVLGDAGPLWVVPTRMLRRKNLAEAILLTRWLRPEAWLVTTAGVSSQDERSYARRLEGAARRGAWKVRFGILHGRGHSLATIDEVVAAAEVLLFTSLQEGFGLPFVEAAAAGKPLIARRLPRVIPDMEALGLKFPQLYEEILIPKNLFDWSGEEKRQRTLWRNWKATLPASCRRKGAGIRVCDQGAEIPVPFSRLTLTAQLEVLARPVEESWSASLSLNLHLRRWRIRAAAEGLTPSVWSAVAEARMGEAAFVRRFQAAARHAARIPQKNLVSATVARSLQADFITRRLATECLYPILMGDA
jgi:glycosyltransferase involved in cell wall biosynthesis